MPQNITLVSCLILSAFLQFSCSESVPTGRRSSSSDPAGAAGNGEINDGSNGSDSPGTDGTTSANDGNPGDETPPDSSSPEDPESTPEEEDCEVLHYALKLNTAHVASIMLLVDRSHSMTIDDRWGEITGALSTVTEGLDELINFGLMLFPSVGANECAEGTVNLDPALDNHDQIAVHLETWIPEGGTPTALSLQAAGAALQAQNPNGANYILLATDGGPACNLDLDWQTCDCVPGGQCINFSGNCLDDVRTLNTVMDLRFAGIETFVIGIPGSEGVSGLLDQMAVAGGTDNDGEHYAVTSGEELTTALRATTGGLVPCVYEFATTPDDVDGITVSIDGEEIARDSAHLNGWDYMPGNLLQLFGDACNAIRDGHPHDVEVVYNCPE